MMIKRLLVATCSLVMLYGCTSKPQTSPAKQLLDENIDFASQQLSLQTDRIEASGRVLLPRTIKDDTIKYVQINDWTSGFFPGTMWYMYDLTRDDKWRDLAIKYTEKLDSVQYLTWHHDVGFMIGCSYLNGYRLFPDLSYRTTASDPRSSEHPQGEERSETYKETIITAAKSLSSRYRPNAHVIQSWDADKGWQAERGWKCPVIIDNMMNLELLFAATELSGDSLFYHIAVDHANTTMAHHYRPDYSCYHVVDYDPDNGDVRHRQTAQGYADESDWARGQAWGLYGFTVCYRYTKDTTYLNQARHIADFIFTPGRLPEDLIPYWDYKAPNIPNEPRDVSAAACTASALYELSTYLSDGDHYRAYADTIMHSLSSPAYRAQLGQNEYFLLMHSVGSIPHGQEIDVPLNYADYYFLEALDRMKRFEVDHDQTPFLQPINNHTDNK